MLATEMFIDSTANARPAMGSANRNQNRKSVAAAGRVCFDERGSDVGILDPLIRPVSNSHEFVARA